LEERSLKIEQEYYYLIGFLRGVMDYPGMPHDLRKKISEAVSRSVEQSGYETR
jgi:hypothetical protein